MVVTCGGSTVRGLAITRFHLSGIRLEGTTTDQVGNNQILGNYIGVEPDGVTAAGNGVNTLPSYPEPAGILVFHSDGNMIGSGTEANRNVISGNKWGINIQESSLNTVAGNYVGTDASGAHAVPNAGGMRPPEYDYGYFDEAGNLLRYHTGPTAAGIRTEVAPDTVIKDNLISGQVIDLSVIKSQPDNWSWWHQQACGVLAIGSARLLLEDNRIGTDAAGTRAIPNQFGAAVFWSDECTYRRNLVSGNASVGLRLSGNSILVEDNLVGLDGTGTAPLGNEETGIGVESGDNGTVRGNVVSCNRWYGVSFFGQGFVVEGNFIGTDKTGTISYEGPSVGNVAQNVGLAVWGANNLIGGPVADARNIISGNSINILLGGGTNRIVGNYIGPDVTGVRTLNSQNGIQTYGNGGYPVIGNIIGGIQPGEGNLISGNRNMGLGLSGQNCYDNRVEGNLIGTDASGTLPLPNGGAVWIGYSAHDNSIGGEAVGAGNLIARNSWWGVEVAYADWEGPVPYPVNNRILGNRIYRNGAERPFAILFQTTGYDWTIPPNDAGDADDGPNRLQNSPVVSFATTIPGQTTVWGSLDSQPNTVYRIEFFANPTRDPSGYGEGEIFLGSTSVTTDGNGDVTFNASVPQSAPLDWIVTATATDADGNTSPFSLTACVVRNGVNALIVTTVADDGEGSLRQAILIANSRLGGDTIYFNIPGTGPHTIQPLTPLPVITDSVVIDGYSQPGASPNTLAQGDNAVLKIILNGSQQVDGSAPGLLLRAGQSEVRGLVVNGFERGGIWVSGGGGSIVAGNFIGTDVTGSSAVPNSSDLHGGAGVSIQSSDGNLIGGTNPGDRNIISGNNTGIRIEPGLNNRIQGNFIGTDAGGTKAISANAYAGIRVDGIHDNNPSRDNLIGGTEPGAGNLISGHGDPNRNWWEGGWGIEVYAQSGTRIEGNRIGTDVTGTVPLGNTIGVNVSFGEHIIGGTEVGAGNLISGNRYDGIYIGGATGNKVQGNLIGTDVSGSRALANSRHGMCLYGGFNLVGGTEAGARNIISGNGGYGVQSGPGGGNIFKGNYVGTDISGTVALPNQGPGIIVMSPIGDIVGGTEPGAGNVVLGIDVRSPFNVVQGNYVGVDVTGSKTLVNQGSGIYLADGADENQIGGVTPAAGNLICGWDYGILINGRNNNRIQGNAIGCDASGTVALGNGSGIVLSSGSQNLIGGTEPGAGNVVVASREIGIWLGGTTGTRVEGNYVGTDRTGSLNLGNQYGVYTWGCQATKLGGTESGAANVVAFNQRDGVYVIDDYEPAAFSSGNSIRGNSIRNNGGLGINLLRWGTEPAPWESSVVTPNDAADADVGPNGLQNYPIIESVVRGATETTIKGSLNSTPTTSFTLDFYATLTTDPSGHGEGDIYLGAAIVTTDGEGNAAFTVTLPVFVQEDQGITATATDAAGNTSEFSRNSNVPIPPQGTILYEWWLNVGGSSLSVLRGSPDYPDNPSGTLPLASFEAPANRDDNFGARMRGTITAPADGEYTFWIASDDDSQLWLSTDADPVNKRLIASVTGWTDMRQWDKYPATQQSAPIQLAAGQTYYVEAIYKEGGGGDHCAVAWRLPGSTAEPEIVPGNDVIYEYWSGIPDPSLSALIGLPDFPNHPDGSSWLFEFEAPSNWADNYVARVSGVLTPPADGDYVFFIASDDDSELWLSTDGNPAHKRMIASVTGWTPPREWGWYESQHSVAIPLAAGTGYYIEALHKEGGGGDNLAVAWQRPDGTLEVIPGSFMSPYVANQPPTVTCPGPVVAEATSPAGAAVTLTASVQDPNGDTLTVTWNVNGTMVQTDVVPSGTPGAVKDVSLVATFPLGERAVTVTVSDGRAEATCQTSVKVQDTTAPAITCPADIYVACAVDSLVPVNFSVTATDAVDASPTVTCTPPSGSGFSVGETVVTCTATDASGNTASCSFKVFRAALAFTGFLPPIGGADTTGGSFLDPVRTFKAGSTIPVKFAASCGGAPVLTGIHRLQVIKFTDATTSDEPIDATAQGSATTGNQFRLTDGQWLFNLDTKATGMTKGIWQLSA
ncbi:MAG TPA: PA14 domain-containing protein, partial [Verrucomicrobiae bacterium]